MISLVRPLQDSSKIRPFPKEHLQTAFNGTLTNRIISALSGNEIARMLPFLEPRIFRTGEYLYEAGEVVGFVYFPETLVVSQICYLEDGSSTAASIVGNDGLLGISAFLSSRSTQYWSVATIGGNALRMSVDDFMREYHTGGTLQRLVLHYVDDRLNQLSQRMICNSRHRLEERLCTWLLMIHDRAGDSPLPLTHEAISHHLGTRRAGVTNFCNILRKEGAISYHRAMIKIRDRQALEHYACECYRRVKCNHSPS